MASGKYFMPRKIRLRDIAEATGFSINTVSHALKDKSDISVATKKLIREKANELGYIADSVAGSMRSGISKTIAVILGDMSNPHFGLWVREIETTAFSQGYSTLIINSDENYEVEREAIKAVIGRRVDGVIICPTQKSRENLDLLKQTGIPFILIGRRYQNSKMNYVIPDDTKSGYLATLYLFEHGYEHILLLNGLSHISSATERHNGYCQAYKEYGRTCDPRYVRSIGVKSGQCNEELKQVIEEGLYFNAIIAFSDLLALEAITVLQKNKIINHPIKVVGFDNIMGGVMLPVSLVSVGTVGESVAKHAVNELLTLLKRKNHSEADNKQIQKILDVRIFEHQ